jgi:predicted ATPase
VIARIVERAEGIPLFAEELTRAILELGEAEDAVPTTLQASLMSRLDRLGAAREVAQAAAVIGRDFDADLLAESVPESAPDLGTALDTLLASRLVLRRAAPGAGAYQFKHALVRDAAYASLLKARREALHATVADRLIARHGQGSDVAPELIAHHYTEAGLAEKAVPQWRLAGGHAAARSAHLEAIAHLSKGLELLATLPETRDRAEQELALKIALGPAILATRGFGDPALAETYERARELAEQLQDDTNHFTALWGLWIYHVASERFKTAEALSTQLLSAAGRHSDSAIHLQAHHAAWTTGFFRGEFASCLDHTEKGESYYDRQRHRTHKFRYGGHDPAVCSLTIRSFAEWLMGFPDRALASSQRAVDLAIEIGHPNSHAQALTTKAIVHYFRGEAEAAYEMGEATVALCAEHGLGMWAPLLMEVSQAALASCGRGEPSLDATRESIAALQQTGVGIFGPFRLATFVDALRRAGQSGAVAESLGFLDAAQSIIDRKGEIWFQAEIHRLRGEVLLDGPAIARQEGEAAFHRALETARTQEARSLELRAATSLARHWVNNDNRTAAHDLLAPVYGWFTEGFDTPDLIDAKELLDGLP